MSGKCGSVLQWKHIYCRKHKLKTSEIFITDGIHHKARTWESATTHNTKLCLILPREIIKDELRRPAPGKLHLFSHTNLPVNSLQRVSTEEMFSMAFAALCFSRSLASHGSSISNPVCFRVNQNTTKTRSCSLFFFVWEGDMEKEKLKSK